MKLSTTKAKQYYEDGNVFPLKKTPTIEMWGVQGKTGIWTVRYDKLKNSYFCNCKNIRNTECSHIQAVILEKGEGNYEEI